MTFLVAASSLIPPWLGWVLIGIAVIASIIAFSGGKKN